MLKNRGACRRRTPRTRADLKVPKDAPHRRPFRRLPLRFDPAPSASAVGEISVKNRFAKNRFAKNRFALGPSSLSTPARLLSTPTRGGGRRQPPTRMARTTGVSAGEAVILSTGTPIPAQWTCCRRCRDRKKWHGLTDVVGLDVGLGEHEVLLGHGRR